MIGLTTRLDDLGTARKLRQRNLERARRAAPEFRRGMEKAAVVLAQETQARAHPSFRPHIRPQVAGGGAFLSAAVTGDTRAKPHMRFQNFGTGLFGPKRRAFPVVRRFKKALRWFEGGAAIFALSTLNPGVRAQEFFARGFQAALAKMRHILAGHLGNVTRANRGD